MKKLIKVFIKFLIMPTAIILSGAFLLGLSNGLPFLAINKRSPQNINNDVKIAILTDKNSYEADDVFTLSMNLINYSDLKGVSVSFKYDNELFETVAQGALTDSYVNSDWYTSATTNNDGVFEYYSISKGEAKNYDYHNNNSLFAVRLKALQPIVDIKAAFNFSADSTMLNFYDDIFVVKLSNGNAEEINYSVTYGGYESYASLIPGSVESSTPEQIDFVSYIDSDSLVETTICEVDNNNYTPATTGNFTVKYSFYNTLTGYNVTYDVPVTVSDVTRPKVSLRGENNVNVLIGTNYSDKGVNVSDDFDTNPAIVVDNQVNASRLGSYSVTYRVTDLSGNKTEIVRTVNVVENGQIAASDSFTRLNKGSLCEIPIYNASNRAITSFTLQFVISGLNKISLDNDCTFTNVGNKYTISGTFETPISQGEKLFAIKGSVLSTVSNCDAITVSLSSNEDNIVMNGNVIDGNYSLAYDSVKVGIYGDANQDGEVTLMDALLINNYLNSKNEIDTDTLKLCDVNLDKIVDYRDVTMIRQYLVRSVGKLGE